MNHPVNHRAAVLGGLVAGFVFIVLEMVLVATVQGDSPWAPPRMIAAIAMGEGVLPPPATFDAGIVLVAMIVHFALSVLFGFLFALVHSMWLSSQAASAAAGTIFGLLIYVIDFYGFTALFPWFAMARGMISIVAHAVFGLVLGLAYHRLAGRSEARLEAGS